MNKMYVSTQMIDRVGRKPVILAASVVFAIGSIVMGAADGKEVLLAGRIVVGIGIGKFGSASFSIWLLLLSSPEQ